MYQTPPAYQPPRRKSKTTLIVVIVLLCLLPCVCVIAFGAFGLSMFNKMKPMMGCVMTMTGARNSIVEYANEKGKFPDADKWQEQVKSYYAKAMKDVPAMGAKTAEETWNCSGQEGAVSGIAYNSELSGKAVKSVTNRNLTVVLFEVAKPQRNAHQPYKQLPFESSPKLMGQPRGWFYITLEGQPQNTKPGGGGLLPTSSEGGD